jgi:ABC-type multidrug transport system fused ATPase/permease subunit
MNKLQKDRTSIVIAHRLSTIIGADRIVVMDKGKIIEEGNHDTLIKLGGHYQNLYYSQFKDSDTI